MSKKSLFLIDGHALCYRSFFAIKELRTSKGQAVNAVYGFINTLRKILREHNPSYLAVCFDSKEKTRRQEKFAAYKIQRPKMPDDLISQIPMIKAALDAYRLSVFESGGYEADDLIATVSKGAVEQNLDVVIVSEDKDMYQLAGEKVKFFSMRKDCILGNQELREKLGFEPRKMVDFIALAGDQSDNIPGVTGIGEVTARKLILQYGDLDEVFDCVEDVKPDKLKEKLLFQKDQAVLSRELAVLDADVPLNFNVKDLEVGVPDRNRLFELFKDFEFQKLAGEYQEESKDDVSVKITTVETEEAVKALVDRIKEGKLFAFLTDVESEDLFQGMYICLDSDCVYQVSRDCFEGLASVLRDKNILKITHNVKEGFKFLSDYAMDVGGSVFDTLLAAHLLGTPHSKLSVPDLAWAFLKVSMADESSKPGAAQAVYQLFGVLREELGDRSLVKLLEEIELPLSRVIFKMEAQGVNLDIPFLEGLAKECDRQISRLVEDLYKQAGEEFNLNSPKQLSRILFEKLKLPVIKKTKTGFSTNESVLTVLSRTHEFPTHILAYRQLSKLMSTYIEALPRMVNPRTRRIHACFDQAGTETGRLSSKRPNLQNIPIRTELGRQIRKAIIPQTKDNVLLAADYSQIELRILAHLSQDENLMKAFESDQDIHRYTSSLMFDVDEKDVTSEMRYAAKRVNFGIVYGMSAFGLAKDLEIPQHEAQDFIDRYFLRYPGVKIYMDETIKTCEEQGYVTTLLKRRRYIPDIHSKNNSVRQFAQRQAINTPVQGSAADLMKLAMIDVQIQIEQRQLQSRIVMTVHDELVFDIPKTESEEMISLARSLMENCLQLSVPIKVSTKTGRNWLDMQEV